MWFAKQGPALAYHDAHADHIVVAEDISRHGHKRYGVVPRGDIDDFCGPYNELIRTNAVCRLYFDLDGGPEHGDEAVRDLISEVEKKLLEVFGLRDKDIIVLCSSNATKFSKHIIWPNVIFKNNWQHMKNFVALINHPLVDGSVYSRRRCFRMAGCHKYGQPARIFRPGLPSSALVTTTTDFPLEFETQPNVEGRPGCRAIGAFETKALSIPDDWKSVLRGMEPDDLLHAIHPNQKYQAFFAIGCAYKRAGGDAKTFCDWASACRRPGTVMRNWSGWNKSGKGYGYPFLRELALHSSSRTEASVHLEEAFGFHIDDFTTTHLDVQYLDFKSISESKEKCLLIKSGTGSGKSTIARALARQFCDKRILYLVSSRPLAYGARDSLNEDDNLHFMSYLETDKPLHQIGQLVCSIQSLWRAFRLKPEPYDLIIADELSSIIEDCTNVTNKHPRENQAALRFFSEKSTRWVGLDAHLMDTSLVLCRDYFGTDVRVIINHHRGPQKDAVFIPRPQWAKLRKIRAKACVPDAKPSHVKALSDATAMYDLMFQCWAAEVKTFFICNNVRLGNWLEENYLRRSFTWMALLWCGLCDDVATLVTDFCCKGDGVQTLKKQLLRYAWIKKGDGRTGQDFKSLDWWSKIDHLQYTLKICQGIDFNPAIPHYGVGFCYTTPNTAVPRRVLQQTGRIRKFAQNKIREHPTVFFAVGTRVTVKHLPVFGLKRIEKFAADQEYFMQAVVQHHSVDIKKYFDWLYEPEPVWRQLYLMAMNERETFLRYPRLSFEWWLRHDNWTITQMNTRPKPMLQWRACDFRDCSGTRYEDIPTLDSMEYTWLASRRHKSTSDVLATKKYKFLQTFRTQPLAAPEISKLWETYCEHPTWVANTTLERFGDLETVIRERFGLLWQTQKNTEWVDMRAARLVIIRKITRKLGITELWNANSAKINARAFRKACAFVTANEEQVVLAFGIKQPTVKKLLNSWGGHNLKIHLRVRKRQRQDVPLPRIDCSVADFAQYLGPDKLADFKQVHGPRLLKVDIRNYLREVHHVWKANHPSIRVDESIREIQSPPWNLLRHPANFS